MKSGRESCECQRTFGNAESASQFLRVLQGPVVIHELFQPKVNRPDPDDGLVDAAHEHLDGRLPVQIDRDIYDMPAEFQAVGRCVRPPAGKIKPGRAPAPDDLVVQHIARWSCGFNIKLPNDHVAKRVKFFDFPIPGRVVSSELGSHCPVHPVPRNGERHIFTTVPLEGRRGIQTRSAG